MGHARRLDMATVSAVAYVLKQLGGSCKYHMLSKILYFADQWHLENYGRPIIEDNFMALEYGPVPSDAYSVMKYISKERSNLPFREQDIKLLEDLFEKGHEDKSIRLKGEPDLNYLSETDIEALKLSIDKYSSFPFKILTMHSHDSAWRKTRRNEVIDIWDRVDALRLTKGMKDFIETNIALRQGKIQSAD
jgi:uncharacterized phage-associated protein